MDSKKFDIDSGKVEILQKLENLFHSKDVNIKELSRLLYEIAEISSKENGIELDDRFKSFLVFSNYEYECNNEEIKSSLYNLAKTAYFSLLQSINNAQPLAENPFEESQNVPASLSTTAESGHDLNNKCDATSSNIKGGVVDTISEASTENKGKIEEISDEKESTQKKLSIVELEKKLINRTPFIVINDLVYHYDENAHYYKLVDPDDVIGLYRYYIDPNLNDAPNLRCFNDLYRCIKTDPSLKRVADFEQETYCSLQDGIYFFHNGELHRENHSPKHITFTCLNASYIPRKESQEERLATCPSFVKFVEDTTGGRPDLIKRLLMALGYLLVETRRGKFFFLAGFKPNTGKSVLFNFIQRLYPQDAVSNLPVGDLGGRFESEALLHSRINISLDLPQEPLSASAVAKLKQITGGDTVEVQRKGKTSKKLDHPVKLVFASNSRLRLKKYDKAFWNRLIYLPFENTVKNEDPDLGEKLWNERDGIVSILLRYAKTLEDSDYKFPKILEDSTKFPISKNPVDFVQNFIDECCETGNIDFYCPISRLKHVYKQYCFMNSFPTCSPADFNDYLESLGIYRCKKHYPDPRDSPKWAFVGIGLKATIYNFLDEV
mgnify:CR=1 FL=1